MINNEYCSSRKVPFILVRFERIEFSKQVFEEYSNIKIHENLSSGSRVFHVYRPTDITDLQSLFAILRTRRKKTGRPKMKQETEVGER
jgi:hypothetical protein